MKKLSIRSFAIGLTIGIVGTAIAATRAGSSIFNDVPVGSYYDSAVGEMYSLGIITGFGDGTFRPNDGLTRGQAAVLMQRLRNDVLGIEVASSSSSVRSSSSRVQSSPSSSRTTSSSSFSTTAVNKNGKFRFTTNAYRLEEDDGTANVSVVRTGGKDGIVSVDYKLVAGTATAEEDYQVQEDTLVFQDGETSKTFSVTVKDDSDDEGDETFTMELSEPTGGAEIIEPQVSTFTIVDNEGASSSSTAAASGGPEEGTFQFTALAFSASEKQENVTIRIERVGGSKGAVSVKYSMSNGTARSGEHYTKTSGTLNYADGETEKSFTLGIDDNNNIEGNKTVNLLLNSPTGGAVLHEENKSSQLTIVDDEIGSFGSGSFRFSENEYSVLESEKYIDITIVRQGGAQGNASVQYKTTDGSARKGADYYEAEGTMTFKDGESSKLFRVTVIKDEDSDAGESVNLNLSNPTGADLTSPNFATLMIF